MEQVLDVYKMPYDEGFPVVCMDGSPKQPIKGTRAPIPMKPGGDKKVDFEYERRGVCNIFMANEPLTGKRYVEVKGTKTKKDWAYFIKGLAGNPFKNATKARLAMDNLNTHLQPYTRCSRQKGQNGFGTGLNLSIPQYMEAG